MSRDVVERKPPPGVVPTQLCEHYACRCARAAELAAMYDRTGRGSLLREAIGVHEQLVRCRMSG